MQEIIHVALGIHDPQGDFACHAGAALASLFVCGTGPMCAHVVHDETLTVENKDKLLAISQRFRKELMFHPVNLPDDFHALSGHVTKGALFRLLLPELVNAAKAIYLDCDIIATMDVRQLWELDLQERPLAAVLDPGIPAFPDEVKRRIMAVGVPLERYFNSGVIVLNLDCLRKHYHLFQQAIQFLQAHPDSVFHDQDALNYLFQRDYLTIDSRFNKIVSRAHSREIRTPAIWHFAGVKPWLNYSSPLDFLYWKALNLTPWQSNVLDRLGTAFSNSVVQMNERARNLQEENNRLARELAIARAVSGRQRWVTLFPESENVHLIKDVGLIPYMMHKHFGCESTLVCYPKGDYPYLENEVKGLKMDFLESDYKDSLRDGCEYIKRHAKNIDFLHVFHLSIRTYEWIALYKMLNPQGKVYLKLDADIVILKVKLTAYMEKILKLCDLISIETKHLYTSLNKIWPVKVEYIPNGFCDFYSSNLIEWAEKENIICTVGRIGARQKANEILLEAFKSIAPQIPDWNLKLIGPVDPGFLPYITAYFTANPQLTGRVIFSGEITSKQQMEDEYRKAKIFCLTSAWESFGIVLTEALSKGCFIISSNVGAAMDISQNGRYGDVFAIGDTHQLARLLLAACTDDMRLKTACGEAQLFAEKNFQWHKICARIADHLLLATP